MVLQREVFEVALTQLLTDRRPMTRAMQVQTQKISLATFPLTGFTGLFVTAGSTVPTLALDLLTEVLLELQSETPLAAAQPFGNTLEVVSANSGLRQFAQQCNQGTDGLLKLIGLAQITVSQHLIDLPIQPKRCLVEQGLVLT